MLSGSDILKILEKIPLWRTIAALPKRVSMLEQRVAELERKGSVAPEVCDTCGTAMRVTADRPDDTLGPVGVRIKTWTCDTCGEARDRQSG